MAATDTQVYTLDEYGLQVDHSISLEIFEVLGVTLGRLYRGSPWAVGDWALYLDSRADWGERASQILEATGLDYQTVSNCKWVARAYPRERRRADLSWSHHEALAGWTPAQQDKWLAAARDEDLSVAQLRSRLAGVRIEEPVKSEEFPGAGNDANAGPLEILKAAYLALEPADQQTFLIWAGNHCADDADD
jgi:hypothetical protein